MRRRFIKIFAVVVFAFIFLAFVMSDRANNSRENQAEQEKFDYKTTVVDRIEPEPEGKNHIPLSGIYKGEFKDSDTEVYVSYNEEGFITSNGDSFYYPSLVPQEECKSETKRDYCYLGHTDVGNVYFARGASESAFFSDPQVFEEVDVFNSSGAAVMILPESSSEQRLLVIMTKHDNAWVMEIGKNPVLDVTSRVRISEVPQEQPE